jgi:biotin-dependent carboxylase-like uncharacterized protein
MGLVVIDPGLSTTVQDRGRRGYRQWGVPTGGAFDRASAALANALLGNAPRCAVLEITLTGGTYQAACPLAIALAGAPMDARIIGIDSSERQLRVPQSGSLRAGERLVLGPCGDAARAYLAVRGGWDTKPILGSRSSEDRIVTGTVLAAKPSAVPVRRIGDPAWKSPAAEPFRIIPGPEASAIAGLGRDFWRSRRFDVSSLADRMGLRLDGDPIEVTTSPERLSAPVVEGAVQVAGGKLIILGVACGTMGGYPHVAHVISADLDRLGQLKPGDAIELLPVTLVEAHRVDGESRSRLKLLTDRLRLLAEDEELGVLSEKQEGPK